MNGISAFIKGTAENSPTLCFLPKIQLEASNLKHGKGLSPKHASTLISDLQPPEQ